MTLEDCLRHYDFALSDLHSHFRQLETIPPPPALLQAGPQGWAPRYADKSIDQALVAKLARSISILTAMRLLVESSFVHEQGILQRVLDEADDDVLFLALGKQNGLNRLHRQYLEVFWREEFEGSADPNEYKMRQMPKRYEIRKYLSSQTGLESNSVGRMIHGVFSGFVHGASTPIFDLLDSQTFKFRLAGVTDAGDRLGYVLNAANYPYRVLMSGVIVARALGSADVSAALYECVQRYGAWLDDQG